MEATRDNLFLLNYSKSMAQGSGRPHSSGEGVSGKLKLWCLQFGLFTRLTWLLLIYTFPISAVEKMESSVSLGSDEAF